MCVSNISVVQQGELYVKERKRERMKERERKKEIKRERKNEKKYYISQLTYNMAQCSPTCPLPPKGKFHLI